MTRLVIALMVLMTITASLLADEVTLRDSHRGSLPAQSPGALQPNSLCAKDERIIFSCPIKRPAKIVSVCASKDLTSDRGYIQYRFGLPAKVELEFPKERNGSQQKFQYSHYFRARVDETEISFTVNGYVGDGSPNRADAFVWAMSELFPGVVQPRKGKRAETEEEKAMRMMGITAVPGSRSGAWMR